MISTGILPAWNAGGVLPPVKPGVQGNSPERSPYQVDLVSFVDRFSTSAERGKILDGLLRFREELHKLGICSGFQWIDGSFLENIETVENRPPNDMDVVTFYTLPAEETQQSLLTKYSTIFDQQYLKTEYKIDGYFRALGKQLDAAEVKRISYWYSMWSHRRNGIWKGFVQIDLAPAQDDESRLLLDDGGIKND